MTCRDEPKCHRLLSTGVKDSFNSYLLGHVAQAGATASVRERRLFARELRQGRRRTRSDDAELTRPGFAVQPSSANFVFATRPAKGGAEFAAALREHAVLVRHFNKPRAVAYLRITVGREGDTKRLIAAAAEIPGQG